MKEKQIVTVIPTSLYSLGLTTIPFINYTYTWGDSDVSLSTIFTAAMLEV